MTNDQDEMIRARAHKIWESEGCPEGREADHWARAEAEVKAEGGTSDDAPAQGTPDYGKPTDRGQEEGHSPPNVAGDEPHRREQRKS